MPSPHPTVRAAAAALRRRAQAAALLAVLALAGAGCTGTDTGPVEAEATGEGTGAIREVLVDGGSETAVATSGVTVLAAPGDTVLISNANTGPSEDAGPEAGTVGTVVHAFVTPGDGVLPPIFVTGETGAAPNAGVWGSCRGGSPAEAATGCPIPPVEGPRSWDGMAYWSTGAMLPGESREVPLATDIPVGTYRLVCALHPDLFVDVVVAEDTGPVTAPEAAPRPAPADELLPAEPEPGVVLVAPSDTTTQLNAFWPETITVEVGQAVTFTAGSRAPHDVVLGAAERPELQHSEPSDALPDLPDGAWDGRSPIRSGYLTTDPAGPAGDTAQVTFGAPGTYEYHCRFHPLMSGTVRVV